MLPRLRALLAAVAITTALPALAAHAVFVDNTRAAGGDGTAALPFNSIAAGLRAGEVVLVAETAQPYVENVILRRGQLLIGSAYGLDAVRTELHTDVDASAPAVQGPGPEIRGTVTIAGDNAVAGCTIVAIRSTTGIVASGVQGTLTIRNVWFRTSQRAFALFLQQQHGAVSVAGGGIDAAGEGSGIGISGGEGDVTFDAFPMRGSFGTVLQIRDRDVGAVTFRSGSPVKADDAADDAIVITNLASRAPVTLDRVSVRGRARGLVAVRVSKLSLSAGASSIETVGGSALELRDSGVDVALDAASSDGAAEGIVIDRIHGRVVINGGTVHAARNHGIAVTQSSNVRLANITIAGSGSNGKLKGARCAGEFDVNTTAPCNAALYLRHVEGSTFENLVIDGGGALGLNANNVKRVSFVNVEVRGAGDESFESGALLQEAAEVTFSRCRFNDNAGSEVLIEQKYNSGAVTFDRCTFAAPARPTVAEHLLEARVLGAASLQLKIANSELHDNAGSALAAEASGTASLAITLTDTTAQRVGTGGLSLAARDHAHASLSAERVQVAAPAAASAVQVTASDSATVCADLHVSSFLGGRPSVRLTATGPSATLRVVTNATTAAALPNAFAAANGGSTLLAEVAAGQLSLVPACP
jgi:hypothetical protein